MKPALHHYRIEILTALRVLTTRSTLKVVLPVDLDVLPEQLFLPLILYAVLVEVFHNSVSEHFKSRSKGVVKISSTPHDIRGLRKAFQRLIKS